MQTLVDGELAHVPASEPLRLVSSTRSSSGSGGSAHLGPPWRAEQPVALARSPAELEADRGLAVGQIVGVEAGDSARYSACESAAGARSIHCSPQRPRPHRPGRGRGRTRSSRKRCGASRSACARSPRSARAPAALGEQRLRDLRHPSRISVKVRAPSSMLRMHQWRPAGGGPPRAGADRAAKYFSLLVLRFWPGLPSSLMFHRRKCGPSSVPHWSTRSCEYGRGQACRG